MTKLDFISQDSRPRFVALFSTIFALLYHACFLFVFLYLKVYPMFYFNIGSVIIFSLSIFLISKTRFKHQTLIICMIEVIFHQIFAEYFLGSSTAFHFLILIIGFIPFFIFVNRIIADSILSAIPLITFSILEIFSDRLVPIYKIAPETIFTIRCINIFLTIFVLAGIILMFAYIVNLIENNLEQEVKIQADKLQKQNRRIINIQKNTIFSLSNLVENRDSDTGEHIRRTSAYVEMLAKAAYDNRYYEDLLTENYIDLLYRAAPMHDIGKIVVSDVILKKPGPLSDEEFDLMKKHTTDGGRIIREILGSSEDEEYVQIAAEIAVNHHEHWNGKGYPAGKKQNEIPLSARIMAIADVFDALVSKRCYKKEFSLDQAFSIIKESCGTHFDPVLTEIFLSKKTEIISIMEKYKD